MSRGDLVIVAVPDDYGKPRPAVIVQSNAIPKNHASVVICLTILIFHATHKRQKQRGTPTKATLEQKLLTRLYTKSQVDNYLCQVLNSSTAFVCEANAVLTSMLG